MNTIVKTAVDLTNKSNQEAVEREGVRLINLIVGEQASIRGFNDRIKGYQAELKKIAESSITLSSVMGGSELPNDGNPNTDTIIKAIEKANKAEQDRVSLLSTNLVADITREQKNIDAANERIGKHREALLKLSASSVKVSDVVGS
jgi:uncharacterized protein YlxW (UPF0749 family)